MIQKLPSEEFLLPVQKFNDTVGPLFAEFRNRFPLNEHTESGLSRSLGIFLHYAFRDAMDQLLLLRPGAPLSREEWLEATPETKREHLKWQSNLKYLKQRNHSLAQQIVMLHVRRLKKREQEREDDPL